VTRARTALATWIARGAMALLVGVVACTNLEAIAPTNGAPLEEKSSVPEDTAPKRDLRLVPAEAYMRTYLKLFGGLAPKEVEERARGKDGGQLFDTWDDYLSALGFPDYRLDLPRATQTNALMMAAFERLGVALCDRSVEHDLKAAATTPMRERLVFAFDEPKTKGPLSAADFAPRFDVLHRTFLSYPAPLAPSDRLASFYELYASTVARHSEKGIKSRFSPDEAGWAAVCYGLVRHPELALY
jgi:hypothetical protein